jgi:hypothetical protein
MNRLEGGRVRRPQRVLELRFEVSVGRSAVTMRLGEVDAHQIELPVTHTALSDDFLRKLPYLIHGPLQKHGF